MSDLYAPAPNPLSRIALRTPPIIGTGISVAGRLAGAACAAYVANTEAYDRTQVFTTAVAALAMLSLVPAPAFARSSLAAFAAGTLFFAGAALLNQSAGLAMLIAGGVAAIGVLIAARRDDAALSAPVLAFFVALLVMVPALALLALAVEG